MYYAAREDHFEMTKKLLENGAKASNTDTNGLTALFYAAREGRLETSQLLIEHGCDVNQSDKKKQTALYWAKKNNHLAVVKMLEEKGAVSIVHPSKIGLTNKPIPIKKKPINEKKLPKKFQLTKLVDGSRVPLSEEELTKFMEENP